MNRIDAPYSIQEIRFASLFDRPIASKKLLAFSEDERALLLTQAARYPWMQRTIAEERSLLNHLSIARIKKISRVIECYASNPDLERQLLYYLPGEPSHEIGGEGYPPVKRPSAIAIKAQVELSEARHLGRKYVICRDYLRKLAVCSNFVFPLRKLDRSHRDIAFFKKGRKIASLEKLVWDVAVLLGWEDLFTATRIETLFVKTIRYKRKNKTVVENIYRNVKGGLQARICGLSFRELSLKARINGTSLRRAFIAMYLLGLRDLHEHNLFVVHGRLKMFDNTFCLPHGNRWIMNRNDLLPVHRFSPLNLRISQNPLSVDEVAEMEQMTRGIRRQWPELKQFLESRKARYPRYWMDKRSLLIALEERIERLEKGLKEAVGKSLCSLMEEIYPEYRLLSILTYLYFRDKHDVNDKDEKYIHTHVGGYYLVPVLRHLVWNSYDLDAIQAKAEEPGVHVADLIKWAKEHPDQLKRKTETEFQIADYYVDVIRWLEQQFKGTPQDHKGISYDYETKSLHQVLEKIYGGYLIHRKFSYDEGTSSLLIEKLAESLEKPCLYYTLDKNKWFILFTNHRFIAL